MTLLCSRCPSCRRPVVGHCPACWQRAAPAPPSAGGRAALSFEGVTHDMIVGLKYFNARAVVAPLSERIAALVDPAQVDVVTWAPTSARRRRRRGFDQAELLAKAVARQLGLPCKRLLRRSTSGQQTGRSRADRQRSPPSFHARRLWHAERVLLIDDVVTTGATLRSAAATLRSAGAGAVVTRAAAATP